MLVCSDEIEKEGMVGGRVIAHDFDRLSERVVE